MRSLGWPSSCALALLLSGCMSDPEQTQNIFPKPSLLIEDEDVAVVPGQDVIEQPACACVPAKGSWYRFTQLQVTKLADAGQAVPDALNLLWSKDIVNYELNIMVQTQGVADGNLVLDVYSGARVGTDGDVCPIQSTLAQAAVPAKGCKYGPVDDMGLTVYSGTQTNPKNCVPGETLHVLPVSNISLSIVHSAVCDGTSADYVEGQLSGAISKELLGKLCTCSKDSSDDCAAPDAAYDGKICGGCSKSFTLLYGLLLLINEGADISYDCVTGDGEPAACIEAKFKAESLSATPTFCPE